MLLKKVCRIFYCSHTYVREFLNCSVMKKTYITSLSLLPDSGLIESLDQNDQMFKPGWKDIFRMNQNELESEIRKVYQDSTLDPRRKAYLVQNLMTRFGLI